jgi:hypothetical protein
MNRTEIDSEIARRLAMMLRSKVCVLFIKEPLPSTDKAILLPLLKIIGNIQKPVIIIANTVIQDADIVNTLKQVNVLKQLVADPDPNKTATVIGDLLLNFLTEPDFRAIYS